MTVDVRCRPIDKWDGDHVHEWDRRAGRFKASWNTIVDDLVHEMEALDAREATIGLSVAAYQIRGDGWPRSDAKIDDPVALMFDDNLHGLTLRYQCDRWVGWKMNLRAISLTLTRLRLVAEAGVGVGDEAYRGFAALPAGSLALGPGMTTYSAAKVLAGLLDGWSPEDVLADPAAAFKIVAKRAHPDVGGDPDVWLEAQRAHAVLT